MNVRIAYFIGHMTQIMGIVSHGTKTLNRMTNNANGMRGIDSYNIGSLKSDRRKSQ